MHPSPVGASVHAAKVSGEVADAGAAAAIKTGDEAAKTSDEAAKIDDEAAKTSGEAAKIDEAKKSTTTKTTSSSCLGRKWTGLQVSTACCFLLFMQVALGETNHATSCIPDVHSNLHKVGLLSCGESTVSVGVAMLFGFLAKCWNSVDVSEKRCCGKSCCAFTKANWCQKRWQCCSRCLASPWILCGLMWTSTFSIDSWSNWFNFLGGQATIQGAFDDSWTEIKQLCSDYERWCFILPLSAVAMCQLCACIGASER